MPKKHLIYGCKGCGSAVAEASFVLAGIEYNRKEVNYDKESPERTELLSKNPLCQVPTVVLPNGEVLTETLAIAHYLQHLAPKAGLIPKSDDLPKFLRWSTFLVTAIYPTFTYGDEPSKWVGLEEGARQLRNATDEHRKKMWTWVEKEAGSPYFLGKNFSLIDLYLAAMVHWRPRKEWFQESCPKIAAVAETTLKLPELAGVWKANFDV